MYGYILITLSWICLHCGRAEECSKMVLAERQSFHVAVGGSLGLSCVVQHCGEGGWTVAWSWKPTSEPPQTLNPAPRQQLSHVTLSANQTRVVLAIRPVDRSDEGLYGCRVTWSPGCSDQGHMSYVNITSASPTVRSAVHRVLVCVGASLCFPVAVGLARCFGSEVKPRPLPRTLSINYRRRPGAVSISAPCQAPRPLPRSPVPQTDIPSTCKASLEPTPNKEPMYAALSQEVLTKQRAAREPAKATVYSSLKFS